MTRDVIVTGIGLVTPLKPFEGIDAFWSVLCSGTDSVKIMDPPLLDLSRQWPLAVVDMTACPSAGVPVEDKAVALADAAITDALCDAGLLGRCAEMRTGIITGTVLGNMLFKEKAALVSRGLEHTELQSAGRDDSLAFPGRWLSERYGLSGPVLTVSTACASGTDAIGIAARYLCEDRADVMIAGGIDVVSDFAIAGFDSLQALARDRVRPFDRHRTGLVLGEGAAFVVMELMDNARARKARPYGHVAGYGSRLDARHLTAPHREGRGLADALTSAAHAGGISACDIDYINVHGTGTVYNDIMETKALKAAFGVNAYNIPLSSTKSMLGHSFGAAGVIEAICCLLAMDRGMIPPTINYETPDPECDLDYVPNEARKGRVRIAASQSAGFGGQNSVIIFS